MVNSDEEKGSDESKADDKDKIGLGENGEKMRLGSESVTVGG